jgi:starch-binding outer membrane protein, SusD/RagB family
MKYNSFFIIICLIFSFISTSSCKKYLEEKPDQSQSTITTLDDLQGLIDEPRNNTAMDIINTGSDEYFVTYDDWLSEGEVNKDAYIWAADLDNLDDWRRQYITIFYANTVLDNLTRISAEGQKEKADNIKGSALFLRAHSFYQLAQLYAPQYDASTASTELGIPLRLNSNFNEASTRSTNAETYDRIIQDLTEAAALLPANPLYKTRPSKVACFALLARTFLQMGEFENALENADQTLQLYSSLLDFNDPSMVDTTSGSPIQIMNDEVIFLTFTGSCLNATAKARIDSNLYNSYSSDDLRKTVFFSDNGDQTYRFKGSYNGASSETIFNGLATDEVYLIRAEANARLGNTEAAVSDLNTILLKRWKAGSFNLITASDPNDALQKVLMERRKELVYRGTRWPDIKRLNKVV